MCSFNKIAASEYSASSYTIAGDEAWNGVPAVGKTICKTVCKAQHILTGSLRAECPIRICHKFWLELQQKKLRVDNGAYYLEIKACTQVSSRVTYVSAILTIEHILLLSINFWANCHLVSIQQEITSSNISLFPRCRHCSLPLRGSPGTMQCI